MAPFRAPPIILVPQQVEQTLRVKTPRDNDVLCGRGTPVDKHPGNKLFRTMIMNNKDVYLTCSKKGKMIITETIVRTMREKLSPPSRFLLKDSFSQDWFDIGFKKSTEKTAQALRDAAGGKARKRNSRRYSRQQIAPRSHGGVLDTSAESDCAAPKKKRRMMESTFNHPKIVATHQGKISPSADFRDCAETITKAQETPPMTKSTSPACSLVDSWDNNIDRTGDQGDLWCSSSFTEQTILPEGIGTSLPHAVSNCNLCLTLGALTEVPSEASAGDFSCYHSGVMQPFHESEHLEATSDDARQPVATSFEEDLSSSEYSNLWEAVNDMPLEDIQRPVSPVTAEDLYTLQTILASEEDMAGAKKIPCEYSM